MDLQCWTWKNSVLRNVVRTLRNDYTPAARVVMFLTRSREDV
jgi:hypothetical protein